MTTRRIGASMKGFVESESVLLGWPNEVTQMVSPSFGILGVTADLRFANGGGKFAQRRRTGVVGGLGIDRLQSVMCNAVACNSDKQSCTVRQTCLTRDCTNSPECLLHACYMV